MGKREREGEEERPKMRIFLPARLFLLIVLFYAGTASSQGNLIQNGDYMDYMDNNGRSGLSRPGPGHGQNGDGKDYVGGCPPGKVEVNRCTASIPPHCIRECRAKDTESSWRWLLSFPEPIWMPDWMEPWGHGGRWGPMCSRGCPRKCPGGTVLSDCRRGPVSRRLPRCRCEPKEVASLLPLLLKNEERYTFSRGITSYQIRRKLTFSVMWGCPEGTKQGGCTKSRPPICSCTPDGLDTLLNWWESQNPWRQTEKMKGK